MTKNILILLICLSSCNSIKKEDCNMDDLKMKLISRSLEVGTFKDMIDNDGFHKTGVIILDSLGVAGERSFVKFGKPVLFYNRKELDIAKIINYIGIKSISLDEKNATIDLRYDPEGVKVVCVFKKSNCDWSLERATLTEH